MKKNICSILHVLAMLSFVTIAQAQVGIGTNSPSASAQLEISSSSKGFLPPRVTLTGTADATTIASPATGLMVYNTATAGTAPANVTPGIYYYDGAKWQRVINQQPDATVEFDKATPTAGGVVFTPNTPASKDYVYVSTVDNSQWTYNGSTYVTYTPPASTPWMLSGGTNDAGSNKSGTIYRTGSVGIGSNTTPNTNSLLDLNSTTKGFLPPRMTSTQRNALTTPAGLVVYNSTDNRLDVLQNTTWRSLATLDGTETLTNKTLTTPTIASGSSQWPSSLSITPTTHGTSKRASIWIDEWSLLQDIVGDGTKNFGIVQTVLGSPTTYPVRLFINTTGNVGLGTTSPTTALHIQNSNSIGSGDPASNTVPGIYLFNNNNASSTAHSILALRTGGSGGGKPYLSLDAAGQFGYSIGLDNPNNRLVINSTWNFDMSYPLNNIVTINEFGKNRVAVSSESAAATGDWPGGWGGGFTTYDISCAGIYYSALQARSDVRLKNSIKDVDESAVNKFMKLRPVNYYWNEGKSSDINLQYGLIAQEVEKIFPEMVFTASDSMQTKSVNYQALHSISMKVIQSQHAEIENLKKNQKDLEDRLRKLERKLK